MKILEILKKFINVFKQEKKQQIVSDNLVDNISNEEINDKLDEYKNIEVLDFIWAKRYKTEEELKNIPKGHEEGPFLVIGKNGKDLLCFCGRGTFPRKQKYTYLEIKCGEYGATKDTSYDLREIYSISKEQYLHKVDNLAGIEKDTLYKHINIMNNRNYSVGKEFNLSFPETPIKSGDIIAINHKTYLVCNENAKDYECLELTDEDITKQNKKINNLYINCNRFINIDKEENILLLNYVSNEVLLSILKSVKEIEERKSKVNIIQRGSVIVFNNKHYYVYGEEGNKWLAFQIYNHPIKNSEEINIYKYLFYTDFEKEIKIDKKVNAKAQYLALEHQIDIIKNSRKKYKNNLSKEKNNNIELPLPKMQTGVKVKNNIDNKIYYIIEYNEFLSTCISEEDFNNKKRNVTNLMSNNLTVISPEIINDIRNLTLDFEDDIHKNLK